MTNPIWEQQQGESGNDRSTLIGRTAFDKFIQQQENKKVAETFEFPSLKNTPAPDAPVSEGIAVFGTERDPPSPAGALIGLLAFGSLFYALLEGKLEAGLAVFVLGAASMALAHYGFGTERGRAVMKSVAIGLCLCAFTMALTNFVVRTFPATKFLFW